MAGRFADFIIRLFTQDDATDTMEAAADVADELDGREAEIGVTEEGGVETQGQIEEVSDSADALDGKEAEVTVSQTGAAEAQGELTSLGEAADALGGAGITGAEGINAISAASAGAVGAIGAVVAVAKKSVDTFVEMGLAAKAGGAAVGMSTEEFSRWTQATDDMMISSSDLTGALNALNRKIVQGSDAFAQYGIATVDANGAMRSTNDVMLDVVDVMSQAATPQDAMRIGTELMGQGFKKLAPLVGTTKTEMEAYLAAVDDGLVVTDEWAADSLETAQAQDELRDSLTKVAVALGQMVAALAPVIIELADMVSTVADVIAPIADLVGGIGDLSSGLKDAIPNISAFGHEFERAGGPIRTVVGEIKDFVKGEEEIPPATEAAAAGLDVQTQALQDEAVATAAAEEAQAALVASLEAEVAALETSAAAHQEKSDAMRAAADAQFALTDAQVAFNEELAGMSAALEEAGGDWKKQEQIYNDVAKSAGSVADSQVRLAIEAATANEEIVSGAEKQSIWNRSMLEMAANTPAASDAILAYAASVNGIPTDVMTKISALVAEGDIASASALLDAASANREALINVDAETAAADSANALIHAALEEPATIPVGADGASALGTLDDIATGDYEATVTAGADADPALERIEEVATGDYEATVETFADTAKAANDLLNLISLSRFADIIALAKNTSETNELLNSTARARTATITAVANTSAAEKALNNVARSRTARITASVSRSNVLLRVDGGG